MRSSFEQVARIAATASDSLVTTWNGLEPSSNHPNTITLQSPAHLVPGLLTAPSRLTSVVGRADSQTVLQLLLHFSELVEVPLVLHLAVSEDFSDVLLLLSGAPFFLVSTTLEEAHDHALVSSKLAHAERKLVIHAFKLVNGDGDFREISKGQIVDYMEQELPSTVASPKPNGTAPNGIAQNGHGHTNGITNGEPNSPKALSTQNLFKAYERVALGTVALVRRPIRPFTVHSGPDEIHTVFIALGIQLPNLSLSGISLVSLSLLSPLPPRISTLFPTSIDRVILLEQVSSQSWGTKWSSLYLSFAAVLHERTSPRPLIQRGTLGPTDQIKADDILKLVQHAKSSPETPLRLGGPSTTLSSPPSLEVPSHESSYTTILNTVFGRRLDIINSPALVAEHGSVATSPEFALGRVQAEIDEQNKTFNALATVLDSGALQPGSHKLLSEWLWSARGGMVQPVDEVLRVLETGVAQTEEVSQVVRNKHHLALPYPSRWIIGSDTWSYDLGSSGLHHLIASGLDINILILDTVPYTQRDIGKHRHKKDIGLYAMNHGDVYVASVAIYASYTQVLQAFMEADRFKGPSIVLAYLPYESGLEATTALQILKETKMAVDAGYWPLYRWNPSHQPPKEPFSLDSDAVKRDLQEFLSQQNHLSQLVASQPKVASELVSSLGERVKEARKHKASQTFNDLVAALDAPPLLILYASDSGNAEKKAKRLANRGTARGLEVTVATMDSTPLESLGNAEVETPKFVVFITSTAGQGEPPQNGRQFFKALNAAINRGEAGSILKSVRFGVFGLGDSHYWPRPEDAHYYNKPSKDLNAKLESLGAERVVELGLGDDQDADGPETGYRVWEPLLWKALGVDAVDVAPEAEPEPITNEHIKAASQYLRGTIVQGLNDTSTGSLSPSDTQLTKFHGIYQQDDRDIRDDRTAEGLEPAYSFMIRVRMPGGVCTPTQWLAMDQISDERGNSTFKVTTRQTFQFHGVLKGHLKNAIKDINRSLLDTLAACGDVNRNVICSAIPTMSKLHAQVHEFSKGISEHLLPRTTAYHEIWLDKKLVAGEALKDFEPLYGEFYLPRKFKIAVAVPPTNDVDVFANDLGFIAIVENGELIGFNVTIGGGMGVTHGNKKTYPRTGDVIGFCTFDQGKWVAEKVMLVQRDNGNRADRKNARLKYTIDRMGLDNFKKQVESLLGYKLAPARPYFFDRNVDDYGWHRGEDGRHHFTLFVENGRIQDEPGKDFKTGLREIAKVHRGTFRLTTNQHLCISDIPDSEVATIKSLLKRYALDNLDFSGLRLSSSACVAFPTCGLAMAESERYLPILIDKVEKICEENGLRNDSIVMRMTGCPNGCARPYVAEVAFVGKAPGTYLMLLGGGYHGQRLNKIYRESVTEPEILQILAPMIKRYALERLEGERFGDFTIRAGYISATASGKQWYEGMGGEGIYKESSAA